MKFVRLLIDVDNQCKYHNVAEETIVNRIQLNMLHCYPPNGLKLFLIHVTERTNIKNMKGTNMKTRRENLIYFYCDNPSLSLTRISQFQCCRKEVHFLRA